LKDNARNVVLHIGWQVACDFEGLFEQLGHVRKDTPCRLKYEGDFQGDAARTG